MAWRNQGITGSNNIPLGKSRRFGGEATGDERDITPEVQDLKRGRSPERRQSHHARKQPRSSTYSNVRFFTAADNGPKRRKKRNRWGDASENKAAGLMGLPTAIV